MFPLQFPECIVSYSTATLVDVFTSNGINRAFCPLRFNTSLTAHYILYIAPSPSPLQWQKHSDDKYCAEAQVNIMYCL